MSILARVNGARPVMRMKILMRLLAQRRDKKILIQFLDVRVLVRTTALTVTVILIDPLGAF